MTKNINLKQSYEHVLKVAAKLFRLKGFASTTVREIARAAGILPGSLHYRYASKEEILIALMERGVNQVIDSIESAISSTNDSVERVKLALKTYISLLLSGDDTVYVLLYEWKVLTGESLQIAKELQKRYEIFWENLIKDAVASGRFRPSVDIKLVHLLGVGAINWLAQWYTSNSKYTPDEIAEAFWNFIAFGVLKVPEPET
ncbi:MAG: TetR family transcriptional regulator [Blastocatellia bacterium]|nr:TetR family transcriptional regulator [Blastocatellia bacterium]